jgi:dolichol-phosphate mannosyltransferase
MSKMCPLGSAVVIPCYRVKSHILDVISRVGPEIDYIICVDDCCPEQSGRHISENVLDPRVVVITHDENRGVGGAMITGYRAALRTGAAIVVKMDGDGQMDPATIPVLIKPLLDESADYTKGNRFYSLANIRRMPFVRRMGNAALSLITKASTGYWQVFDPTNGFTAIHAVALGRLSLDNLNKRFFFESDILFQLNIIRAVVVDAPMDPMYGDEVSNLRVSRVILPFLYGNARNLAKRFVYNYVLRDFNLATLLTLGGVLLVGIGALFGVYHWILSISSSMPATAGTVMVAALPIIVGLQMLLSALSYDFSNTPIRPLCKGFSESGKRDLND